VFAFVLAQFASEAHLTRFSTWWAGTSASDKEDTVTLWGNRIRFGHPMVVRNILEESVFVVSAGAVMRVFLMANGSRNKRKASRNRMRSRGQIFKIRVSSHRGTPILFIRILVVKQVVDTRVLSHDRETIQARRQLSYVIRDSCCSSSLAPLQG
jgi:hypothetical protein